MNQRSFSVEEYLLGDYLHTLFPLGTTSLLVDRCSNAIKDYLYNRLLATNPTVPGFPAQQRCYAAKKGYNLRRTVKLDPVAEFFVYDVVFRNRKSFRPDHRQSRKSYGYRFSGGKPTPVTESYRQFKAAVAYGRSHWAFTVKTDVATYFNNIYHHDLVNSMRGLNWPDADVDALGRFLRESNAGRSLDCLPQGIHPCKVLGSEFLRFVENSYKIQCPFSARFLDDIHLFSTDESQLIADLISLQQVLGEKGLSLNDAKTAFGSVNEVDLPLTVDAMKQSLLQIRRKVIDVSGKDTEIDDVEHAALSHEQIEYLLNLLETPDIDESDAELVLVLLRDYAEHVIPKMLAFLAKFPGLTKAVYHYARLATDRSGLDELLAQFVSHSPNATEYQLFLDRQTRRGLSLSFAEIRRYSWVGA